MTLQAVNHCTSLPAALMTEVFSYLNHEERTSCEFVCRSFYLKAGADTLWKIFLKSSEVITGQARTQAKTFLKDYCTYFNKQLRHATQFHLIVREQSADPSDSDNVDEEDARWEGIQSEYLKKETQSLNLIQMKTAIDKYVTEKIVLCCFRHEVHLFCQDPALQSSQISQKEKILSMLLERGPKCTKSEVAALMCYKNANDSILCKIINNCSMTFYTTEIFFVTKLQVSEAILLAMLEKTMDIDNKSWPELKDTLEKLGYQDVIPKLFIKNQNLAHLLNSPFG